jgi:hypothetical protein
MMIVPLEFMGKPTGRYELREKASDGAGYVVLGQLTDETRVTYRSEVSELMSAYRFEVLPFRGGDMVRSGDDGRAYVRLRCNTFHINAFLADVVLA